MTDDSTPLRSLKCLTSFSGFTLFELIVVMIIIGLMSVLVAPRLAGPLDNLKLKTSANRLAAMLRFARNQAVTEKKSVYASFDFEKNQVMLFSDIPGIDDEASDDAGRKIYKLPDSVFLESLKLSDTKRSENERWIKFSPNGGNSGGIVSLKNSDGDRKTVHLDFITGDVMIGNE